jgi:hypothetical protein
MTAVKTVLCASLLLLNCCDSFGDPTQDDQEATKEKHVQTVPAANELLNVAERRLLSAIEVTYTLTQHLEGSLPFPGLEGQRDLIIHRDLLLDLKDFRFDVKRRVFGRDPKPSDPNDGLFHLTWDGKLFVEYQVGEHFANTDPHLPEGQNQKLQAAKDPLLKAMLIYPPTPGGTGIDDGSLVSLLRSGHLRKGVEDIDGRSCCVLDFTAPRGAPGRAWLDIERSLAPLKIETYDGDERKIDQEWHLTEYAQLNGNGQDFWCPMKVDITFRHGSALVKKQIIVEKDGTRVNPAISDASFRVDFPRFTVVHDSGTDTTHMIKQPGSK